MPPLWSLGYQQSHRTLASREEILAEARTFREKKLPCDTLIYLGTGFCPSGWNTGHGSWDFNPAVFPDPEGGDRRCSDALHFRVVPHVVIRAKLGRRLGRATRSTRPSSTSRAAASYWNCPSQGRRTGLRRLVAGRGRPARHRRRGSRASGCTGRAEQLDRPDAAPLRAASQRLRRHAALRRVPLVGRRLLHLGDAEDARAGRDQHRADRHPVLGHRHRRLRPHARSSRASCTCAGSSSARSARCSASHGRTWKLRLPWGWNTGELGPDESAAYGDAGQSRPEELHNAEVEPICRKYLELRYRLMPYLYSAVREAARDGPADHARALAALPRRPGRRRPAATSISGAATSWSRR